MPVAVRSLVRRYAEDVLEGRAVAGRWVRLAAERYLADLQAARDRGWVWDEEEVERLVRFCSHLRQSKGRWALAPLELLPWQVFVLGQALAWKDARTGRRRFRRVYVEVGRKNGKTTMAAALALWLLDLDGEPGAEVYVAATHRQQARQCWDEAYYMVQRSPALRRRIQAVPSRAHMYVAETASRLSALGADSDTLDGLNPHGVIIDELHAHRRGGIVDRLETATGARSQPLLLYITTAGDDQSVVWRETREYSQRVLEGHVDDPQWLAYVACLDGDDDWTNEAVYAKANPSLGVTVELEELVRERDRAVANAGRRWAFRRFRLGLPDAEERGWVALAEWDACADPSLSLAAFRGRPVYAGLDLAATRDTTALVLLAPGGDGSWLVWEEYWVPEQTVPARSREDGVPYDSWVEDGWLHLTPGAVTDYSAIRERIRELVDSGIAIRQLAYDRWGAVQLISDLRADGLDCIPVGMGYATMTLPIREIERLLASRQLRHRGSPVTRWQLAGTAVSVDSAGNAKPDRARSRSRIDGVVALLMAAAVAVSHHPQMSHGPSRSVYDERGIIWL